MAQLTVYAKTAGDWDVADAWNDQADGLGTNRTNPQNGGGNTYICDLNNKVMNLNVAVSVDQIITGQVNVGGSIKVPNSSSATVTVAQATDGLSATTSAGTIVTWGTGTCSITINGDVKYWATSTTVGAIAYTTSQTVVSNGKVTNNAAGYALIGAGSGVLTISNVGGTAISGSGSGRVVSHGSTGNLTVSGAFSVSAGAGVYLSATATVSITGDATVSGGSAIYLGAGSASCTVAMNGSCSAGFVIRGDSAGSTVALTGNLVSSDTGAALRVAGTAITWTGAATLSVSTDCYIALGGGTLALASGTGALALANSGSLTIYKSGGTLTTTSGANTASIVNQSATSYATIIGGSDANKACITGASIPSAADTRYGVARGWADGGTGATAGCGVAGGNGLLEIPNTDAPTGAQDAASDACVVSGKKYGSPQRTGTAAGGGYTYGDEDQQYVLTTATGAGTYVPPAASAVQWGVDVGTTTGTLVGIVDATGVLHPTGIWNGTDFTTSGVYIGGFSTIYTAGIIALVGEESIYHENGVYDGTTWYATGIMDSSAAWHADGVLNNDGDWLSLAYATEYAGGTYHEATTAEVRKNVAFGAASALTGTLTGIVTDAGVLYATGIWDGSQYSATTGLVVGEVAYGLSWADGNGFHEGTMFGSTTAGHVLTTATYPGSYTAIAANNALRTGSGYFGVGGATDGNYYGPSSQAGVTTTTTYGVSNATSGTLNLSLYTLISTITWPTTDEVDGGVTYGIANERVGTGVNATTIRTALGLASANLDTQLTDIPTVAEFNARTLAAADYATAANLATLKTLADKIAVACVGNVAGAGTGTEVFTYGGVTATITVDVLGNRTVVFS